MVPWADVDKSHLRAGERVRRHLHAPRPAPAEPRRGGPVPVPAGGELGPLVQRLPRERRPPLPRRGQPPRVRHPGVRRHRRAGRPRQGGGVDPRRSWSRGRRARLREEGIRGDIYLFKNNTDSAGNSYGCHENYLTSRRDDFSPLHRGADPLLGQPPDLRRRRQGAPDRPGGGLLPQPASRAHLGGRVVGHHPEPPDHQHPGRAPRRCREVPSAARHRGRLQHERVRHLPEGGATSILLRMLEDPQTVLRDLTLENPIRAIREISHDITCRRPVRLANGRELSALDIQSEYLQRAIGSGTARDSPPGGPRPRHVGALPEGSRVGPAQPAPGVRLGGEVPADRPVPGASRAAPGTPTVSLLDLQYHDVDRHGGLYYRLQRHDQLDRICDDATSRPPCRRRPRPPGPGCAASSSGGPRSAAATSPSTGCTSSSTTRPSGRCCSRTRSSRKDERVEKLIAGL